MITIQTFSPATGRVTNNGPYDNMDVLERFLSNKIRQYIRVKSMRKTDGDVLFSFGVLPPLKERNGVFHPAGVVLMEQGMPKVLRIQRFVGTLNSLAEPSTFRRYIRHENGPK